MCRHLLHAVATLLTLAIAGCASLGGYPEDPGDPDKELAALQVYFAADIRTTYDAKTDPQQRKDFRDEVVFGQLRAYDIQFKKFEKALTEENSSFSIGTDLVVLALNAAGAATGGSVALSAASGGVVGAKGSVDKNLFYQKTLPALLAQMEARRTDARVPIEQGLSRPDAEYSLHRALADLSAYDRAGSIPGAISEIVKDAGVKGGKAEAEIKIARTAEFTRNIPTAVSIQGRLKALSPSQALAVAKAMEPQLATRRKALQDLVNGVDPASERLRSGNAAKQVLLMWQINDDRDPVSVKQWTDALDAAEKK